MTKISHDEAIEIAGRLIAGAFRRDGEVLADDKRPRFSIPTQLGRDDDVRIIDYIQQQASESQKLREALEEILRHDDVSFGPIARSEGVYDRASAALSTAAKDTDTGGGS